MIRWFLVSLSLIAGLSLAACGEGDFLNDDEGKVAHGPFPGPSYIMVRRGYGNDVSYSQMDRQWSEGELRQRERDVRWKRIPEDQVISRGRGYPAPQSPKNLQFVEDPNDFIEPNQGRTDGYKQSKRRYYQGRRYSQPRRYDHYRHIYPYWSTSYESYFDWCTTNEWYYQPAYQWDSAYYYYSPCSNWNVVYWGGYAYYNYCLNSTGWW